MLHVYLIHGFRSSPSAMRDFFNEYKRNKVHLDAYVDLFSWDAGEEVSDLVLFLTLLIKRRSGADEIKETWDQAVDSFPTVSKELADTINSDVPQNGDVLLVGHSMGAEIIRFAAKMIRPDISIHLFFMAGISNTYDAESLADLHNVQTFVNLYSRKDMILNDFLPNMDTGNFYEPIGSNKIPHKSVQNLETAYGHSDYLKSRSMITRYSNLVTALVEKNKR